MGQAIQLIGAVIVLSGFVANQRMGLSSDSVLFLVLNAVGTAILAVVAGVNRDLGFLLLEGVWAIVSTLSLVRAVRRRPAHRPA
jgi:di/tricarboxylate transporter